MKSRDIESPSNNFWQKSSVFAIVVGLTMVVSSCVKPEKSDGTESPRTEVLVRFDCGTMLSKARNPDESLVQDINLYITGEGGLEEGHRFIQTKWGSECSVSLLAGANYNFYAFANAGYDMGPLSGKKPEDFIYYMTTPDGYSHGIPMSAVSIGQKVEKNTPVILGLERLMSKISICIDRRELNNDVNFYVSGVRIGNCPRLVRIFADSRIQDRDSFFPAGFYRSGAELSPLNNFTPAKVSGEVSLYTLENKQDHLDTDLCSYVELEIDYLSDDFYSTGKGLVYRFYLREHNQYCVERNCHYHITVCPDKSGLLSEDRWRVDKSNLVARDKEAFLRIVPSGSMIDGQFYSNYYELGTDDSLHFAIEYFPDEMDISLRQDLVDDEISEGRAIYTLDPDRKGFRVKALGRQCCSPMELIAGEPLNDSETIIVNIH